MAPQTAPRSIVPVGEDIVWLRKLPKAELHLHLEGTVTPETLVTLSQRHDAQPLTLDEAIELYNYTDFIHFLRTFRMVCDRLQTPEDYALVTRKMIKDLAAQGVVHAEVYIAWGGVLKSRTWLVFNEVMASIEAVRVEAERELGVSILWIIDATRQWGADACGQVFDLAIKWRDIYPSIIGIGIGGDEMAAPCALFKEVYAKSKAAGLRLTAHAGESTGPVQGPQNIKDALDMEAERIGHGTCAFYDEGLMEILRERQTPIEVSVTSNLKTGVCQSPELHPIKQFVDQGLMVTINSDDPAMFGSNLLGEYVLVQKMLRLAREEMCNFARNSVQASFLPDEKKAAIMANIERYSV